MRTEKCRGLLRRRSDPFRRVEKQYKWGIYGIVLPHKMTNYPIRNALI